MRARRAFGRRAAVQDRPSRSARVGALEVARADLGDRGHGLEGVHLRTRLHRQAAEPADVGAQIEHARAAREVRAEERRLVRFPAAAFDRGADYGVVLEDLEVEVELRGPDEAGAELHSARM